MNLDQALIAFVAEAGELLERIESALLACERDGVAPETISELFRAAHTIKGSAGLFGLDDIVSFTHAMETSLDRVRAGKLELSPALIAVLVECSDHLKTLVGVAVGSDPEDSPVEDAKGLELVARLQTICGPITLLGSGSAQPSAPVSTPPEPAATPVGIASADTWHLSLRFGPEVLRNGMDPLACFRYLRSFGEIVGIEVITDALPTPDAMDPERCYLGFELGFRSSATKERIESAFDFVREDSRIRIMPPRSHVSDYVSLIHDQSEGDARLGEMLVRCGTLTARELGEALQAQTQNPSLPPKPLGEVLIERRVVQPPVIEAALDKQRQLAEKRPVVQDGGLIRIEAGKLDRLIDLIGQLTLTGANVDVLAQRGQIGDLRDAGSRLAHLVKEVRASALQLRMVQIGATFSRFQRIVRDVANELGKNIALKISGAETELDKSLIEQVSDPLLHLVRNAIDHGIETPEVRVAKGKPAQGTLSLSATQDAGCIVIEVSDDGGGINRDRVLEKARQQGLVAPEHTPTDQEILNLILQAGFSTAEVVTNLSGRGVGMDVVKRNIEQLRGSLEIESPQGKGTTFRIRLPLTLAIIDGFLLKVGGVAYVVPLDLVEECVDLEVGAGGGNYLALRGRALPLIPLYEVFGHTGAHMRRRGVIVVRWGDRRAGLVVDELLGKLQTVIKPMSPLFEDLGGVTGSTILGDGTIGMILDVPELLTQQQQLQ